MARREPTAVFENDGYCPCCRANTVFLARREWLRDYYVCTRCWSIPRQRHIQAVLDDRFPGWENLVIHESSPSHDFISRYAQNYSCSQFFPEVARGSMHNGVRCEDIENLTYPDESIDLFVTQDVMEHVFHPDRAIADIHRTLRPGGAHVFTAPKHKGLLETVRRAELLADGTIKHILEEQYHGNPIGDNRALVTFDYGYDFEALLSTWSGASVEVIHTLDRSRGIDAEFNEVFVIRKSGARRPAAGGAEPAPGSEFPRRAARKLRRIAAKVLTRSSSR